MEEMVWWSYQENIDEMNQKLMYAILELEKLKVDASEESRKNKEYVMQLIQLLNITIQERDEARNQLQKLLEKFMLTSSNESLNILPQIHVDNPLLKARKTNSSINESTQSNISSPVDVLFDAVSSPEFSNFNMLSTNQVTSGVPKIFNMLSTNQVPSGVPKIDCASLIIDNLVKGRVLPQTGKLLRAVVEAGPLLQTLLVAGPLPRWQNPPRLQPFQIPPAPIKGYDQENFAQMSCGSSQISSAPMLNFANVPQGSSLRNGLMMSTSTDAYSCIPLANSHSFYRKFEGYPPSNLSMHEPGGGVTSYIDSDLSLDS
ncbi:unnamed protein product [Fraxinus pennsylvanica]|uniref:Uncharacterized protein n=1 Tax=Fraxinus pennsylvanica TaxID=56036 RepID=A0AAD1ZJB6_9LAMI|nr:unnamed protein product [Fraxinus pennsylvanica]